MAIEKLTQSYIASYRLAPGVPRIELRDHDVRGLVVFVTATSKTFQYRPRVSGELKYHNLGRFPDVSLADARKAVFDLKSRRANGNQLSAMAIKPQNSVLTFTDFFNDHYLPYVKPRKRSWQRDEELFRLRLQAEFGSIAIDQITRHQIQLFHTGLLAKGLAPATCDHHVKLLKHALNLAIDWNLLTEKNPAARIPLFNADNRVEHLLSDDEFDRLLTVLRTDENRTVCLIAIFLLSTGARLNTALQAKWSDIDRENCRWTIPPSNSKSKKAHCVPLGDSALDVLSQLDTEDEFEYLFINRKTKKPYTTIMKVWSRLRNKAGLPHFRIHDLRHGFASLLAGAGHSLLEIGRILQHSNPSITDRYAHLTSGSLLEASNSASAKIREAMKVPA